MRFTSIAVLIAFLLAVIATQAMSARVLVNSADTKNTVQSHVGLLANEAESFESEQRQELSEDSDEQFHRYSNPEKSVTHAVAASDAETTRKTRRSNLGNLRTRAP